MCVRACVRERVAHAHDHAHWHACTCACKHVRAHIQNASECEYLCADVCTPVHNILQKMKTHAQESHCLIQQAPGSTLTQEHTHRDPLFQQGYAEKQAPRSEQMHMHANTHNTLNLACMVMQGHADAWRERMGATIAGIAAPERGIHARASATSIRATAKRIWVLSSPCVSASNIVKTSATCDVARTRRKTPLRGVLRRHTQTRDNTVTIQGYPRCV
jgi:hypothetical protein